MGYEVHITRKKDWRDEEGPAITLNDWLAYITSDPELSMEGFTVPHQAEGETIVIQRPGMAAWVGYSEYRKRNTVVWFTHFKDRVSVKDPDAEIIQKMYGIAQALNGSVQGDKGEIYDADGNSVSRLPGKKPTAAQAQEKKSWWKVWS